MSGDFFVISNFLWLFRSCSSLEIIVSYHGAGVWYESFLWSLCSSLPISTHQIHRMHSSCGLGMWQQGGRRVLQLSKWDVSDSINLQVRAEDLGTERLRSSVGKSIVGQVSGVFWEIFFEEMKFEDWGDWILVVEKIIKDLYGSFWVGGWQA